MVNNARIADLIREGKAEEVTDAIAEGEYFQMQTFTQSLIHHVLAENVEREIAADASSNKHDFLVSLEQATKRKRADDAQAAKEAEEAAAAAAAAGPLQPAAPEMPALRLAQPGQ